MLPSVVLTQPRQQAGGSDRDRVAEPEPEPEPEPDEEHRRPPVP
jgi:hypothetical protein